MTIEQALFSVLGDEAAHSIIADMGLNWAVVAAMAAATTADDPEAITTIRHWGDGSTPCNVEYNLQPLDSQAKASSKNGQKVSGGGQ